MAQLPLVTIRVPSESAPCIYRVALRACRLGCYVTAGRGRLELQIRYGRELDDALTQLLSAPASHAADIELGGELWVIDSSLKDALADALIEIVAHVENRGADSTSLR